MRIVQVIPSLDVGGAERIAALLALAQQRGGDDVSLVSLFDAAGSWIEAELREAGIGIHFLAKRPGLDLALVPRLARTLAQLEPDVVHTHLHVLKYTWAARRFARQRFPVVHTVHNLAQFEAEGLDLHLSRVVFRRSVVPVAIGDEVARSIHALYGIQPRWTIPNGIIVADFAAQPGVAAATRAELGIGPGVPVLFTAGRLNRQKNHAGLLEAFADPRLAELGALLLMAGDGELRPALEEQAAALGIAERVRFLGVVSNVPQLLAAADAFVLSSDWEGNPLVVMEAMAAGKPIVSTAVGCVPELVSEATGSLVEPGDMAGLSEALAASLGDPALLQAQGEAAAGVARERFDVSSMAEAYGALYRACVGQGKRPRRRGLGLRRGSR
jgi:glycosyltransferase involved in cell wall biosynthesis